MIERVMPAEDRMIAESLAPVAEQDEQVNDIDMTVAIEVAEARFTILARPPRTQQMNEIKDANHLIAVKVAIHT